MNRQSNEDGKNERGKVDKISDEIYSTPLVKPVEKVKAARKGKKVSSEKLIFKARNDQVFFRHPEFYPLTMKSTRHHEYIISNPHIVEIKLNLMILVFCLRTSESTTSLVIRNYLLFSTLIAIFLHFCTDNVICLIAFRVVVVCSLQEAYRSAVLQES